MKLFHILISSLLLTVLAAPAVMANNPATPGVTQAMPSEGTPDLVGANKASQQAIRLMGQKNYYAKQYHTLNEAAAKATSPTAKNCLESLSKKAKHQINLLWRLADGEFLKLIQACGYAHPKDLGKYGEASRTCAQQYVQPFLQNPVMLCSKLTDSPNPKDPSCFEVDARYPMVSMGTTDYLIRAGACK